MDKRKFSIFISSTYEDLIDERQALVGVALECGFIPVGMEQFHGAPISQWSLIKKMIDDCDFFLLVIAGRYGSIDGNDGVGYTEKEYNYAKSKGVKILVLIRDAKAITSDKMDKDIAKQRQLQAFIDKVKNDEKTVDSFDNIDSLKYKASQSLHNLVEYADENSGWVRYRDVYELANGKCKDGNNRQQQRIMEGMESLIKELEKKLDEMQNNLIWDESSEVSNEEIIKAFVKDGVLHIP